MNVVVKPLPYVARQSAPRLPRLQRIWPAVVERPVASDVRRSLPLAQPGLREHQDVPPTSCRARRAMVHANRSARVLLGSMLTPQSALRSGETTPVPARDLEGRAAGLPTPS